MTIAALTGGRAQIAGDGVTDRVDLDFQFVDEEDLLVIHTDTSGTDTEWTYQQAPGNWSFTGGAYETGTVFFTASDLAAGERLTVTLVSTYEQPFTLEGGEIDPEIIERSMDRTALSVQAIAGQVSRSLSVSPSLEGTLPDLEVPDLPDGYGFVRQGNALVPALIDSAAISEAVSDAQVAQSAAETAATNAGDHASVASNAAGAVSAAATGASEAQAAAEAAKSGAEAAKDDAEAAATSAGTAAADAIAAYSAALAQVEANLDNLMSKVSSIAVIQYRLAAGQSGGTNTTNAWTPYPLNHIAHDPEGIVDLVSNEFTSLIDRVCDISVLFFRTNYSTVRLYNVTDGVEIGTCFSGLATNGNSGSLTVMGSYPVVSGKTYRIEYFTSAVYSGQGLGPSSSSGSPEVYGQVILR
ncbi:hypothetical protein [Roseibium aggregatum]|uniref:Uncharacterized protein n=1 Tax=Roseibium aggregatum TaxID=187304 RepID=A0A939EFC3_9HYPH|nr:hypothetical protein [Roseibium aggregatum]MBN9671691.1 hypothetical protein [Roseibium aggregatum]